MTITVEVVNGTIREAEDKAIELSEQTGEHYSIMKYNDMAKIIEQRAKYINDVRAVLHSHTDADIDKAYKQGWDDCKKAMLMKLSGGEPTQDAEWKESEPLPEFEELMKEGHWIEKEGREEGFDIGGVKTWYIQIMCDKCGFIKTAIEGHIGQYKFCPNCGARMGVSE